MRRLHKPVIVLVLSAALLACSGAHREKYLAKGNHAYQHGQYAEASINYHKALQSDPNFGEGYYRLGVAESKLGHVPQALAALSRAAALMPDNDDVQALLGEMYLMRYQADRDAKAYAKLNQICDRLLTRNSQSFAALRLKGYLATADGKPDQALDLFTRANRILPLVPDVATMLSQTLLLEGRIEEALKLGRNVIAAHPESGPIYDTLYGYYMKAGNLATAEQILITKVKNNPADAFPVEQLAEHYWRQNQRPRASETIRTLLGNPKSFPQAHMLIGEFYQRMGAQEEAVRAFEEGAAAHPHVKAAYQQGAIESLILAGERARALDRIAQLLAEESAGSAADNLRSTRAGLLLASPLEAERKLAVHDLETLVAKAPDRTAWRFQLGRAYAASGQFSQARHALEIVVRREPDRTEAWLALAEAASRSFDFAASQKYAEEALARDPSLRRARLLRASALVELGQYNEARLDYDRLIRENPNYREARLQRALLDVVEGQYAAAEKEFRANYDPAHGDFRALEGLMELYFSEGHPEQAFAMLDTQTAVYPQSLKLAAIRAATAARAGKWDLAIREYERLRAQQPDDAGILLALGDACRHAGDFARAIPLLQRAQSLRPGDWRAPYLLGYAYQMTGKPAEAEAAYRLALHLNPDYPDALNNLAFLLAENPSGARLQEALQLAQKAVRASGGSIESADTLGWIYFKQDHLESAQQIFSRLVARNPHDPMLHYHFGLLLRRTGDRAASDRELHAAFRGGLPAPDQQAARRLLAED